MTASDPTAIRSVAVTLSDVVAAYEARERSPRRTVLRVTPPFTGRMRARIHTAGPAAAQSEGGAQSGTDAESDADANARSAADARATDLDPETGALHLPPARFVSEEAIPSYPNPDDTEDALREDPDVEFSVERHRERHVEAVEEWREAVRKAIVDRIEIQRSEGSHEVAVKTLRESSGEA